MKKLILINGTMGVGKSSTCQMLYKTIENSVWVDGDWCWMMHPFTVNEENKKMVEENIVFMLRNFLNNSNIENVIFSWVMHQDEIINMILKRLEDLEFETIKISLICSKEELEKRIKRDAEINDRTDREIEKSFERMKFYENMDTIKIDTTNKGIEEVCGEIVEIVVG
ncbi:MAG: AAA family ATPase, partial [Clostridium sp.]